MQKSKTNTITQNIFYFIVVAIFLLEGLGLPGGRTIALFLVIFLPIILYFVDYVLLKKRYIFPRMPSMLYGLFILCTLISTVFSLNIARSIPYFLFYCALYLLFIYTFNHACTIAQNTIPFLYIFSVTYIIYTLFLVHNLLSIASVLIPQSGYQMVYPSFGLHNHLGDFLVLPMLVGLYYIVTNTFRRRGVILLFCYLPFFLYSYSRSAYVSFLLCSLVMLILFVRQKQVKLFTATSITILVFFSAITFFFVVSVREDAQIPVLSLLQKNVVAIFPIRNKLLFTERLKYLNAALLSIEQHPFFGVGPNNYIYISKSYFIKLGIGTDSSHNLLIDIFSENGIFAGLFFTVFIIYLFFYVQKRHILFYIFLALFINFQTDYTSRIYMMMTLFIVISGLLFKESSRNIKE